jgi:hypothetical protein
LRTRPLDCAAAGTAATLKQSAKKKIIVSLALIIRPPDSWRSREGVVNATSSSSESDA